MFIQLFVLLSAVSLLSGHRIHHSRGIQGRIYGGVDTSIETTPYQVSLQYKNGEHFCGGSIYSRNIIVTAAHCLEKTSNIYVRAGSDIYNSGGSLIRVSKMAVHEKFSMQTMFNDVALLLLSSPLEFSIGIQPIPLASSEPKDGTTVIVSGWGQTETEDQPIKLKSVNVTIVPREKCAEDYGVLSYLISEKSICAAAPGKDSCNKDSGGPLVHNNELVGIVSFGKGCANPDYPGVYMNVALIRNWILKKAARLDSKVNRN